MKNVNANKLSFSFMRLFFFSFSVCWISICFMEISGSLMMAGMAGCVIAMLGDFINGTTFSLPSKQMIYAIPVVLLGLSILGGAVLVGAAFEGDPIVRWGAGAVALTLLFFLCFVIGFESGFERVENENGHGDNG